MPLKDYKRIINQKGNIWYQVGINKKNPNHLTKRWISIREHTPYIKKTFPGSNWRVHTPIRINKKTINGHFKNFKTKKDAMKFAMQYMRVH